MSDSNSRRPPVRLIPGPVNGAIDLGVALSGTEDAHDAGPRSILRLLRQYWLLGVLLAVVGTGGGVASVVLSSPIYKVRTLLEVQGINEAWLKNTFEQATSYDSTTVNIQTQIKLLKEGPFLRHINERLKADTLPPPQV